MRAHQPGSTPIDIPETVPNPAHTPAPAPERAPTKAPDKVPEKVIAPASFDAFFSDQARDMAETDQQFPSVSSQNKGVKVNADGSVDVYFGPKATAGFETTGCRRFPARVGL